MASIIFRFLPALPSPPPIAAKNAGSRSSSQQFQIHRRRCRCRAAISGSFPDDSSARHRGDDDQEQDDEEVVEDLVLPEEWSTAPAAAEESQWLRRNLHRWLDEEYCPEPANAEISDRCATVYYRCLIEKELDAGNILMRMVENLESFSFKQSFHGAFSSANAAVRLIVARMEERERMA